MLSGKNSNLLLAGARDAAKENWNDPELKHPRFGFLYSGILFGFIPSILEHQQEVETLILMDIV